MTKPSRPVGPPVEPLPPGLVPDGRSLFGATVTLERLDAARHGQQLWDSFDGKDPDGDLWTYMAFGPFAGFAEFQNWLGAREKDCDPYFYAIVERAGGAAAGMAALMRVVPQHGNIELGSIWLAPGLQRTRAATEALYVLMRHALDELGNRRLEWKCDALNGPSRAAALRLGFQFEGIFRQHLIIKGRNRDTAWYAITDEDWQVLRPAFQGWLRDDNFDEAGRQKKPLAAFIAGA